MAGDRSGAFGVTRMKRAQNLVWIAAAARQVKSQ